MVERFYLVENNSALESLIEQLDDYGVDYDFDALYPVPENYFEVHVWCYPHEIWDLENIFAPYV